MFPTPIIPFNPPVYICQYNNKPFTLDGKIFKDFWADIPFTDYFVDIEGDSRPTPRYKTRAKICWDNENVYFSAILEGDEIWANLTERDCVIFYDNDFEIFLDPNFDTQEYYEFEMNALNTVWDLLLTKAYRDGGSPVNSFDIKGLRTAVHIEGELNNPNADNKYWSVEVVFPFTTMLECAHKKVPFVGDYWRMNFSRVQWLVDVEDGVYKKRINPETGRSYPEDNWVWAPTGLINIHYPEMWGFLVFADDANTTFEIPEDEKRKWFLRQIYYMEKNYWEKNHKFTSNYSDLTDEPAKYPVLIETTKYTFEATCLASDGCHDLFVRSDGQTGMFVEEE